MRPEFFQKMLKRLVNLSAPYSRRLGGIIRPVTPGNVQIFHEKNAHIFCGYYDVTPFDHTERYLLALRCCQANVSPHDTGVMADIGYYDLNNKNSEFHKVAQTGCWNWQQGCRQQWLPGNAHLMAYNEVSANGYRMIICDAISGALRKTFDIPFYALHKTQMRALSLNFSRLHQYRRGYGYHNFPDIFLAELAPLNDGLWQIDIESGKTTLLVNYQELADFAARPDMTGAFHYLNHLQWAPDGETIIFFHQWVGSAGKKQGRLILRDPNGLLRELDPLLRPSHTAWSPEGKFLVTGHRKNSPAMYHLYDVATHEREDLAFSTQDDGHPSFLTGQRIISDTYPDLWGRQNLYLQDIYQASPYRKLATFYVPPDYQGETRCDFHPRLSPSGRWVAIDVVYNSVRAVAVMPVG